MIRILITGSRSWVARNLLGMGLVHAAAELAGPTDEPVTLVSGACPHGADRMAEEFAESWGWVIERHPADWNGPCRDSCRPGHRRNGPRGDYCPAAGNYRNQDMVDLGADACLAFRMAGSRGTTHCGEAAERAGIPTRWIEAR